MSWKYRILFALATFLGSGRFSGAQSADKIIQQYIRAAGGAKALARIKTVRYEGTARDPQTDKSGSFTLLLESPNRLYSEIMLAGQRTSEAYNGRSAWKQDGSGGISTLTGAEATNLETIALYRNARFLNYKKEKVRVQLLGRQTVGDRPAFKVEVKNAAGLKRDVFFDRQSHLVIKEEAQGTAADVFYSDYRPVDGVMEPFRIELHEGTETLLVSTTKVFHNAPIQEAAFDFPKSSHVPLPDIPTLLTEVEKNQKAIDAIIDNYACRETEEEDQLDGKGQVKQKSVREYEVFHLGGDEVTKLIKKGGKELSPAEQQRENERVEKHIREYQRRQDKKTAHHEKNEKHEENDVEISDFLRACRFTSPRREHFRGQDVVVFDFSANPAYKPQKLVESLVQKLAGVVWIDEQAKQVVRLEAYLSSNMKLVGGLLASMQKGSAFVFEQTKVNGEVWLPSYAEGHFSARLLLVKGYSENFAIRYSDWRKFRVQTVAKKSSSADYTDFTDSEKP